MQHAHIQDKYISNYVCNVLTCKHGKAEGAEGETQKTSPSKKGKKRKYLIMLKYYQNGANNGFSWKDVPNKPSQKPYFDNADSSQTLLIAHLLLKKESQVLINSRNTSLSSFPPHSQ